MTIFTDIALMYDKYGFNESIEKMDFDTKLDLLDFRIDLLKEELNETELATGYGGLEFNADEVVDGLIDLIVVAAGTLDHFGVDSQKAWDAVHKANNSKEVGIKEGRPNPLGLPDLTKPEGWVGPSHLDNLGLFKEMETKSNKRV